VGTPGSKKYVPLLEAILCSFALMVFSFFIRSEFPFRLVAVAALFLPAWIFSQNLQLLSDLGKIFPASEPVRSTVLFCFAGTFSGIGMAIFYRRHLGISFFPYSFHLFVIVAALIGCTEEIVFRGFLQDQVKSINGPFSILFSTISHTAYKCCLFLSPMVTGGIDIRFLAVWTFSGGILLGTIKHFSKSILPPIIAHMLFDIMVYAGFVNPPWWVW
jgi:membrane protease YdiL (CAAX protease family)